MCIFFLFFFFFWSWGIYRQLAIFRMCALCLLFSFFYIRVLVQWRCVALHIIPFHLVRPNHAHTILWTFWFECALVLLANSSACFLRMWTCSEQTLFPWISCSTVFFHSLRSHRSIAFELILNDYDCIRRPQQQLIKRQPQHGRANRTIQNNWLFTTNAFAVSHVCLMFSLFFFLMLATFIRSEQH